MGSDLQSPLPKLQHLVGPSGWRSAPPSPADQKLEAQFLRSTGFPGILQERAQWIVERGRGLGQGLPGCRQRNPPLRRRSQPTSLCYCWTSLPPRSQRSLFHRPAFPYLRVQPTRCASQGGPQEQQGKSLGGLSRCVPSSELRAGGVWGRVRLHLSAWAGRIERG